VQYPSPSAAREVIDTSGAMALRIIMFIFFGIASSYVSRRCDYISKKEKQFREITKVVFKNVKTGLLLLDTENRILLANDRACVMLGRTEADLAGKSLGSIHLKPAELRNTDTELRGASDYFRRADGSVFPVSIEDAILSLPAEAVIAAGDEAPTIGMVDVRILNFGDLSHFLHLQSQTRQLERIKAAANMAKEMAHQIRTPLTGISGAVQLLQLNLKNPQPGELVLKEREELCGQIVNESVHMDKVIQNFLDYAEFSPKDIRDLIQMDIDHTAKRW
jgi:PAS domain S-box-containing protein